MRAKLILLFFTFLLIFNVNSGNIQFQKSNVYANSILKSDNNANSEEGNGYDARIVKKTAVTNPTGMQFGFWPTGSYQEGVLNDFGKRPIERNGFTGWNKIETKKGVYNWKGAFDAYKTSHKYGQNIISALNVSFSSEITKNKQTIPGFYSPRITYPETREAAKKFIYAYVQQMLKEVGAMYLSIDYEICSNYKLSSNIDNANEWSEWYVEAAAVARKAAADLGKPEDLKLIPIVNGNPFESPIFQKSSDNNQWLKNVVNASDYLGIDSYYMDSITDVTDPSSTINIIKYWIDNFSGDKPIILCENGFTSVSTNFPSITSEYKGKYAGTEEQQREYFKNLFNALEDANKQDGIFKNKLRGFNIWSYIDNPSYRKGDYEVYFGLVRLDNTKKPAYYTVKDAMDRIENDEFNRSSNIISNEDVSKDVSGHGSVELLYKSGTEYEYLNCIYPNLKKADKYTLNIQTQNPGNVILSLNGMKWLGDVDKAKMFFQFDLSQYLIEEEDNVVDIYFTSEIHPFLQNVIKVELE